MSNMKYDIIPIKKVIDNERLVNDVIAYMYSRVKACQIDLNSNGNTYTILISPLPAKGKEKTKKLTFITIEMHLHTDSCAIGFTYSKARPILNVALATVAAPIFIPCSVIFLSTAACRIWYSKNLNKEVIKFISVYAS